MISRNGGIAVKNSLQKVNNRIIAGNTAATMAVSCAIFSPASVKMVLNILSYRLFFLRLIQHELLWLQG